MGILNFSPDEVRVFVLILIRVSTILFLFPIFSSPMIPNTAKAAMALVLSLFMYTYIPVDPALFPETVPGVGILVVSELFIGLTLGLSIRLLFASVQLAGQLVGFQMGFGMINVLDPQTGAQVSILEQIGFWVMVIIFLILNGHHVLIATIADSFNIVKVGVINIQAGLLKEYMVFCANIFSLAIKIGAPAIVALLLTSAAFGLTAKFEPKMNIMIVGFPLKIVVGLIFFGMMIQTILIITKRYVFDFAGLLLSMLNWLTP